VWFITLQTPIYEAVTDARDNLAGALLFAGQHAIPEVKTCTILARNFRK